MAPSAPPSLCHPDRSVRLAFPPQILRRAYAEWRDLLLATRYERGAVTNPVAPEGAQTSYCVLTQDFVLG